MSLLSQVNGDDYPDAAGKHLGDSKVLMAGNRHDRVVCGRGRNPALRLSTFSAAGEVA